MNLQNGFQRQWSYEFTNAFPGHCPCELTSGFPGQCELISGFQGQCELTSDFP